MGQNALAVVYGVPMNASLALSLREDPSDVSRETKATSKWIQDGRFVRSECDFEIIAECGVENGLDHARLIADALNVKDETGLTPRELVDRIKTLEQACQKQNESICQALGKALDYPRYCDDQANFPGATEADGVCTADHVAESLATAAAERIKVLEGERAEVLPLLRDMKEHLKPVLVKPGRSLFWRLVDLIAKLEGTQE